MSRISFLTELEFVLMKIAQVCPRYYPHIGGVETHVREISEGLVKRGFEVDVLTTGSSSESEEVIDGVVVRRFESRSPNEAYYFSNKLKEYLANNAKNYSIVHAHSYHALPALYAMQAKDSNMLVFTPHYLGGGQSFFRGMLHFPYRFVAGRIFDKAERVICVSEYEKELVLKGFRVDDEKVLVIPNGVDREELSKFKWSPSSSRLKITYSGRLEKRQKKVDKLIRSFGLLVREYGVDADFVVIGRGPYEREMSKLIEDLGLQNRIFLKSWLPRDQYLEELASSNVFVMPSECECYCITAAEAITMGVPTVVADSAALHSYAQAGLALGIDTPVTEEKIARAVNEALTMPSTRKPLGSFDGFLSWEEVVDQLVEKVYR